MLKSLPPRCWLVLLWAVLTVGSIAVRPLIPVDETRYASVAWEMWLRNDFLVPHLNGETYSHKPPLLFWLMQLGWLLFGVNDWSLRLISPAFALACLLMTAKIARYLWRDDRDTANLSPFVLLSSFLWVAFSTLTMFDIMLTFFALLGVFSVLQLSRDACRLRHVGLLALAIGGGVLTKGPVILLHILPLALLAPWWLSQGERAFSWRRWYGLIALGVIGGALIALAWAVPAGMAGGEAYRHAIFLGQTSGRVVDSFAHKLPWWWYLQFLPLLAMPWAFTPMFWHGFARIDRQDQGLRFCVFWLLPVLLAFSVISGKRVHYLLPLVPAFSLLVGRLLSAASEGDWKKGHRYYAITLGLLGALLALLPLVNGRLIHLKILMGLSPTWGLLVMGLALPCWLLSSRDAGQSVQRIAAATVFCLLLMAAGFFSLNGIRYDTTPAARKIAALQAQQREVAIMTDKYHGQFQFTGRLQQPLRVIYGVAALQNYAAAHPDNYLVLTYKPNANVPDSLFEFRQPYKSSSMLGIMPGRLLKAHPELGRYLVP